ncbi:MAG: type I glutamate--ammonia ligase [Lachnospiraceae bacterium]|nr:type I glutamate--ammonia ligase [Lachnospiraceae bacterium]
MSDVTAKEILQLVEEEDVEFIRLQFVDILGNMKNVAITSSQLERALTRGCMFDGSSIEGFVQIEESDMCLKPDLSTLAIFPWRPQQGKVARLICDVYRPDGSPFDGDPRYILKKEIEAAAKEGFVLEAGPESEFFLFDTDESGQPTTHTNEKAGYFDMGPVDFGENARRDIVLTLEDMGFVVVASHHEMGPGQHGVDLSYEEALKAADEMMTFKLAVKTVAKNHGLHATFMPKPKMDTFGSGLHLNLSLAKDGVNIFGDAADENGLSKEAYYFMGGLLKHMKGITAIANPIVNSYKRLAGGLGTPKHIAWSRTNRSALIRIPSTSTDHARIELRNPDGTTNPYLLLALCLRAGMDGIRNQIMPPAAVQANINEMTAQQMQEKHIEALPLNLKEALAEMENDPMIRDVLGEHLYQNYLKYKKKEWDDYSSQVSDWEVAQYLLNV